MWCSEALGGMIREPPETLTEAKAAKGFVRPEEEGVRRGPFVPRASLEGEACPEWPPRSAWPMGIAGLWVFGEVASRPAHQPIHCQPN